MIDAKRLVGRKLTLLLLGAGDEDREEGVTFCGTVRVKEGALLFVRPEGESFPFKEEWLAKVEKVRPEVKQLLLGADFVLTLEVGRLSGDEGAPDWIGIEVQPPSPAKR